MTAHALLATIQRVTLAPSAEPLFTATEWAALAAFILLCLTLGAAISHHAWRDRRQTTPEGRAYRSLARAMGLERSDRARLTTLARASGIAEVALLLSRAAYDRAAADSPDSSTPELRRRLFPDRSTS